VIVLGIDVCSGFCSAAIVDGGTTRAERHEPMTRGHVERLAPMVADILAEADLTPSGLGGIAVTTGPGSFTGARLGVSFARGLSLATRIPAVGISVFEAMATDHPAPVVVVLPGKQSALITQAWSGGTATGDPVEETPECAAQGLPHGPLTLVSGDTVAVDTLLAALPDTARALVTVAETAAVTARSIAVLGAQRLSQGTPPPPAPLYVRPPDAKPQKAPALA